MAKWHLTLILALLTAACADSPAAPSAPPVAACVSQNTATITLTNASPINGTYDIVIDGITKGTIGPGKSENFTVVAGVTHTILSRYTNSSVVACNASPSLIQCSTQALTCRG